MIDIHQAMVALPRQKGELISVCNIYICQGTDWNSVQFRTVLVQIGIPNCPGTDWNFQTVPVQIGIHKMEERFHTIPGTVWNSNLYWIPICTLTYIIRHIVPTTQSHSLLQCLASSLPTRPILTHYFLHQTS